MTEAEIVDLLGEPQVKRKDQWIYDFNAMTRIPDHTLGVEIYYSGVIDFTSDQRVQSRRFAIADPSKY